MIIKLYSAVVTALETHLVTVELLIKKGRQSFSIAGMTGTAVQECKNRIGAVLHQYDINLQDVSVSVNLAPSNIKKSGSSFDLPVIIGILKCFGKLKISDSMLRDTIFLGELSFAGDLRSSDNIVPVILDAKALGMKRVVAPLGPNDYSEFYGDTEIIDVDSLDMLNDFLKGKYSKKVRIGRVDLNTGVTYSNDFKYVIGQQQAKRMLQIAIAGNHNTIMVGPPGSGKTMLANCATSLQRPLTLQERMEVTRIYSSHQNFDFKLVNKRPFRSPHHSISTVGMTGGGSPIMPGELSLSHNGILFLDELTEFKRSVIENLRQPIESRSINISRASNTLTLPCSFTLICSMNPCACGNLGNIKKPCQCTSLAIYNYLNKISGPFLDRIDLQLFMQSVDIDKKSNTEEGWDTATLSESVNRANAMQASRYQSQSIRNGFMSASDMEKFCVLDKDSKKFIDSGYNEYHMSMRSYHKIIKVARTIADLDGQETINIEHINEAYKYRGLEQKLIDLKNKL